MVRLVLSLLKQSSRLVHSRKSATSLSAFEQLIGRRNDNTPRKQLYDIFQQYGDYDEVPWEELTNSLVTLNNTFTKKFDIRKEIFINYVENIESSISYYNYLLERGEKLNLVEYGILLSALANNLENITRYERLVFDIYKEVKPHITDVSSLQKKALKVFTAFPTLFEELYARDFDTYSGLRYLICSAFNLNKAKEGWALLRKYPETINCSRNHICKSYFNYCLNLAENRKLSPSHIDNIVQFYNTSGICMHCENLLPILENLCSILNDDPCKTYDWSVRDSTINENKCTQCNHELKKVKFSTDELNDLKSHFYKNVICNKNVFIKTNPGELNNFCNYLDKCPPYDLVIDVLNILHLFKDKKWTNILENISKRDKKILVIGKRFNSADKILKALGKKYLVFLTEPRSDDDAFILYAALNGGNDTYFISADQYRGKADHFEDSRIKNLFRKWHVSHQYWFECNAQFSTIRLRHPHLHSLLPQKTVSPLKRNEKGEHCWHLSVESTTFKALKSNIKTDWICLRAVPRQ